MENDLSLVEDVDENRKRADTKALDISMNELADMHNSEELIIRPEYQRMFRWSSIKQSQFIESLILEMPIPPIFVIELSESKWELIDGLQRISSYLHFRGELEAPDLISPIKKGDDLKLQGCSIVTSLNGKKFKDLPTALQIRLKRHFIRVEVVKKETDRRFKYHMFNRLNTGGEKLSFQEIRNCTIRLLGERFNSLLIDLSKNSHFQKCTTKLSDAKRQQMGDVELVLRYFAFSLNFKEFTHDIGPFLTDFMERVTDESADNHIEFNYKIEKERFEKIFKVLAKALGEDTSKNMQTGQFSMHHFESLSIGLYPLVDKIDISTQDNYNSVITCLKGLKGNEEFEKLAKGGGKNSRGHYEKKFKFVKESLEKCL